MPQPKIFGTVAVERFSVIASDVTRDRLFDGKLVLYQPARGYRVGVDALLLAAFAAEGRRARLAVDLGAGVGAVALALIELGAAERVELVEREPELFELARQNLALSGARGQVHRADLEQQGLPRALAGRAELVVSNPPFFERTSTRPQKEHLSRAARSGELEPFVAAAARALAQGRGRAVFAYPSRSLATLFLVAREVGLEPKRMRLVHPRVDRAARLALVELKRAKPGGLVVEAPLIEWIGPGRRSAELKAIVSGKKHAPRAQRPSKRSNRMAAAARTLR